MNDDQKLDKILQITEETNKTVKRMRRIQVLSGVWKTVYWIVVIGIGVGAFYYTQRYIENVKHFFGIETKSQIEENIDTVKSLVN